MFTATGIMLARASGPFGDTVAFTRPSDGHIILRPRRRLTDKAHKNYICEVFHDLDEFYHQAPQPMHELWNDYVVAPFLSGYDAFMSQSITAHAAGFYAPDIPGDGDGSSSGHIVIGCVIPPNEAVQMNPIARILEGTAILETRTSPYGMLEFRYHHQLRDPRLPDPPSVTVHVEAFWIPGESRSLLIITGDVGIVYDTGWITTHYAEWQVQLRGSAWYKSFLLDEEFHLEPNVMINIPQQAWPEDGPIIAEHGGFIHVAGAEVVQVSETKTLYGTVGCAVERILHREPYWWYHLVFHIKVTARPNYVKQPGRVWIRAIYDKINFNWRLNHHGKLRGLFWKPGQPWTPFDTIIFRKIVRVSNPHIPVVKIAIRYRTDAISFVCTFPKYHTFDTANHPVIARG